MKAATTIACRFVEAFGDPIVTPSSELTRVHALYAVEDPRLKRR